MPTGNSLKAKSVAPYDTVRQTPLTHSFCQHVVTNEAVLFVKDAKNDPRVRGNLAVKDLNVIACAADHP